jgi:hypothetical protein
MDTTLEVVESGLSASGMVRDANRSRFKWKIEVVEVNAAYS